MIKEGSAVTFKIASLPSPDQYTEIRGAVVKMRDFSATIVTQALPQQVAMFELNDGTKNTKFVFMSVAKNRIDPATPPIMLDKPELALFQDMLKKFEPL